MMDLKSRWAKWSGTANEVVAEAEMVLSGTAIEPPTRRSFDNYVVKGCVSPAAGHGGFGGRQILQAIAVKVLLKDGWPLERIAEYTQSAQDEALSDLISTSIAKARRRTRGNAKPARNPAMEMVMRLKAGTGIPTAASTSLSEATPVVMHANLPATALAQSPALLRSARLRATPQPPPYAASPKKLVAYSAGGLTLTVDPTATPKNPAEFDRLLEDLARQAASDLYHRKG